jgi:hypothetical protein
MTHSKRKIDSAGYRFESFAAYHLPPLPHSFQDKQKRLLCRRAFERNGRQAGRAKATLAVYQYYDMSMAQALPCCRRRHDQACSTQSDA